MTEPILTELSTPSLRRAIIDNLYDFFRFLGRSGITELEEGPGWRRWYTPIGYDWYNGVLCWRNPIEGDANLVEQCLTFFRERGTPAVTWWCSPDVSSQAWGPYLQAHGFQFSNRVPGMAIRLDILPAQERLPESLKIIPVDDAEKLETWVEVFAEAYPMPAESKADFLRLLTDLGPGLPMRNYLGCLDGKPVATSNLYLGAGVAGVQYVSTLPESRGRGVGAAMTLAPLYQARQLGYQAGVLQSSEMGYPVYRRLGFQHLCSVEHFDWEG
jgi:GNAT superfamily N-acetyltransferase